MDKQDDVLDLDEKDTNEDKTNDERPTLDLYDANKGILKRDGGPYLDNVERERDEVVRAAREGRDVDLKNPPPSVGTPLVPKHYLRETDASASHVSAAAELENKPEMTVYVPAPEESKPDPNQVDWDNDHQKVRAMSQLKTYEEGAKFNNAPDQEPTDEAFDGVPSQNEGAVADNNEKVVTGVGNSVWQEGTPAPTNELDADHETQEVNVEPETSKDDWEK